MARAKKGEAGTVGAAGDRPGLALSQPTQALNGRSWDLLGVVSELGTETLLLEPGKGKTRVHGT